MELENEFNINDKRLQVGFYLNDNAEKTKLENLAQAHGIGKSALLRMLILKEWRRLNKGAENEQ